MILINQMLIKRGYIMAASQARYSAGVPNIIVLLAYSEEAAYNFIDMFSSGDCINAAAETFEHRNPDYPIARGPTLIEALTKIEDKLAQRTREELLNDGSPWCLSIDVRLCEMLEKEKA